MSATTHFASQSGQSAYDSMKSSTQSTFISKPSHWAGLIISGLVILFLLFDAITNRLGFPVSALNIIAVILLACTIAYAIPRTSILGAVLLTGYLGGAVATQLRAGSPAFETVFPVLFGVLVWLGAYLRDVTPARTGSLLT
jgi:hypothetical protein